MRASAPSMKIHVFMPKHQQSIHYNRVKSVAKKRRALYPGR